MVASGQAENAGTDNGADPRRGLNLLLAELDILCVATNNDRLGGKTKGDNHD